MSKINKAEEADDRDIFDKALDYAPIIGGAVIGGAVGRAYGKRQGRLANKDYDYSYKEFLGIDRSPSSKKEVLRVHMFDGTRDGAVIGAVAGVPVAVYGSYGHQSAAKKRRQSAAKKRRKD